MTPQPNQGRPLFVTGWEHEMTEAQPPSARSLSTQLQALHRLLLMSEAAALSLTTDPYKLMGAAMSDPRLAWLTPLLKLIVAIDEADDAGQLAADADVAQMRERVERLLYSFEDEESDFAANYTRWRERSEGIAGLDGHIRRTLAALPERPRH